MSYSTSQFNKTTLLRFWSELDLPCSARIVENVDNVENVRRSPSEQPRNMGSPTNGPDCIPLVHAWDRRCGKPMIRWNLAWRTRPSDRALGKVLMHFHLPRWKMLHWSKTTWYAVPSWTWTAFATAGLRVADVASLMLSITHLWPSMLFCWRQSTFLQRFTIRVYRCNAELAYFSIVSESASLYPKEAAPPEATSRLLTSMWCCEMIKDENKQKLRCQREDSEGAAFHHLIPGFPWLCPLLCSIGQGCESK